MRTRRDFSGNVLGLPAIVVTLFMAIHEAVTGSWGVAVFFLILLVVCAVGFERMTRVPEAR